MKNKQDQDLEINTLIFQILKSIGDDRILTYLQGSFSENIYDLEKDIENELNYAKNETDSYKSQKKEALKYAKHLQKLKQENEKLLPHLDGIIKTRKLIKKLKGY
jgi:hypothetical protein